MSAKLNRFSVLPSFPKKDHSLAKMSPILANQQAFVTLSPIALNISERISCSLFYDIKYMIQPLKGICFPIALSPHLKRHSNV